MSHNSLFPRTEVWCGINVLLALSIVVIFFRVSFCVEGREELYCYVDVWSRGPEFLDCCVGNFVASHH